MRSLETQNDQIFQSCTNLNVKDTMERDKREQLSFKLEDRRSYANLMPVTLIKAFIRKCIQPFRWLNHLLSPKAAPAVGLKTLHLPRK